MKFSTTTSFLLALATIILSCSLHAAHAKEASATFDPRSTDFIDCNDACNGGDVNYELRAHVRTMQMQFGPEHQEYNYTYRGRTFSQDGSDTHMGPTMRVQPGQSLWIKLINDMKDVDVGPSDVTAEHYWKMLQNPGEAIKYPFYKEAVASPDLMIVDEENMPGDWDVTNLHLHGLDVQVHMFDPVGTHNPKAPHIAVHPGQCYCYRLQIPEDHPDGMYWYHPHLHGSSAVQLWGGLMGLIYVEGNLEKELKDYNVHNSQEFVLWDPAFQDIRDKKPDAEHDIEVDEFLLGQTTLSKIHPFLVNGQYTANYDVKVNEVLHLRALCGTIENENTFIVYKQGEHEQPWDEVAVPFYVIASDGVTYEKPKKRNAIVMAGGQREEILLQFDEPGTYVISQQGIQGMQFFDMYGHPHDQLLATITVSADEDKAMLPTVPIMDMRFTPGYKKEEDITNEDIVKIETVVFSMGTNRDQAPFPQYYINGHSFDSERIALKAEPNTAVEYLLINDKQNAHPFHIHVNRFQIKDMGSELSTDKYPALKVLMDYDENVWRDTVVVPPLGRARIHVQYKEYTGKTVFHCHFLAHEDTGMMGTLFIGPPDEIFDWREHIPLLMGVAIGVVLGAILIAAGVSIRSESEQSMKEYYYSVVAMNDAKAKVLD